MVMVVVVEIVDGCSNGNDEGGKVVKVVVGDGSGSRWWY